jgi:RNA polymerase sigma-70 factor, ECF subfamily
VTPTLRAGQVEPDAALVDALRRTRDARAFDALYARHTRAMYGVALRLAGDPERAADVVHDAWLRAVERADRFEGRSSVRTWLVGFVVNRVRELWRDDRASVRLDDVSDASLAADEPEALPHDCDPLDVERAIASLPPGFRAVVVLHDVEGFTHEEIAELLGVATGTSKSQLARARQRLRAALSPASPRTPR